MIVAVRMPREGLRRAGTAMGAAMGDAAAMSADEAGPVLRPAMPRLFARSGAASVRRWR